MRKTVLAIAILLCGAPAQAADDCRLALAASLDIDPAYPHRVVIPAELDGTAVKMLVDTGGVVTMVGQDTVEKFKLRRIGLPRTTIVAGYDGSWAGFYTFIPSLRTGNIHASDVRALIDPENIESGVAGLIGPDLLMHYEVELDFGHGKINLFSQDHCAGQLVYWTRDPVAAVPLHIDESGHIQAEVTLDGKDMNAIIDTGAPQASMKLSAARRKFDLRTDSPGMSVESSEHPEIHLYAFKSLVLGGVAIANPKTRIFDVPSDPGENRLLLIGLSELRKMHVMISYKERMLYVTAVNAH
jgi:predicted aspartyl protease